MNNNSKMNLDVLVIRDIRKIILVIFSICLTPFIWRITGSFLIAVIYAVCWVLRLRAVNGGIVIDVKKDLITFPGGNVTYNTLDETFKNIFQSFKRYEHRLSEIHYITAESGNGHKLTFHGLDNTVTLYFKDKAKRDQVYALITNINEMGSPVVNR